MNDEQLSRLEKVRALLAKAEGTTHPEEAKLFFAKAQELMAKWAIDDAMLLHLTGANPEVGVSTIWIDANEYRSPKVQILNAVAKSNDCRLVLHPQTYVMVPDAKGKPVRKRRFTVSLYGFEDDRKFTELLYTSMLLQVEQSLLSPAVLAQAQLECDHGGHHIKWRNTFTNAFASAIWRRFQEIKSRAQQQGHAQYGNQMAMVLIGKSKSVDKYVEDQHPKLRTMKSSAGQGSGSASRLGSEAGERADIGRPKMKNQTNGLLE